MKVGDRVNRHMGANGPTMPMVVEKIEGGVVTCGAVNGDGSVTSLGWTFDLASGAEIDHELKWGPQYGITGTYIKPLAEPSPQGGGSD